MAPRQDFPPVRATIFDMDGLLIDSEDAYTRVTNTILLENGRPELPWAIKAKLQGRPGPAAGRIFFEWAKLPIPESEYLARQKELQRVEFQKCKPLPGVESLLKNLSRARIINNKKGQQLLSSAALLAEESEGRVRSSSNEDSQKVHMAVATSSHKANFDIKTKPMTHLFAPFPQSQIVVGDDPRVPSGRGKPLPDIYLLALDMINQEIAARASASSSPDPTPIRPEECLVFEDSVPGVEAGRRAGMRVIWCPHPGLLSVYSDRIEQVLAGQTGEHDESALLNSQTSGIPLAGSPGSPGSPNDGWAEMLTSLEDIDYQKYGIDVSPPPPASASLSLSSSSSPSIKASSTNKEMTDKQLEEMTAVADGKVHAAEEGVSGNASPVPALMEDGKV